MNKATSPATVIDREAAAALMEPLTDLVIRAGAAILAVNRGGDAGRGQARRIAGDGGRSRRRPDHRRRPGAARAAGPGAVRGTRQSGEAALRRQLLPDRSARRHQGIRRRPRRIHRQSRAGDERDAIVGHRRRAGARTDLARTGRPRRGTADSQAKSRWPSRSIPAPIPQRGEPWIAAVSRSHGDSRTEAFIAARPGAIRKTLGSAVKFGRVAEGQADIYPRLAPTSRMGYRGRPRHRHRRRRQDHGRARRRVAVRQRAATDFIVPEFIAWGDPSAAA